MKEFDHVKHVKNLPDSYAKSITSNNYKILQVEKLSVDHLQDQSSLILKMLDINMDLSTATPEEKALFSQTLTLYGEMVNQPRGAATDEQYRLMIKSKLTQCLSDGTFDSVLNAICLTFGCDPSEISLVEGEEPCSVYVEKLPVRVISKAGLTANQTVLIIKRLLPAGVEASSFAFDGTFEFAADESDMAIDGATKGFTDTEENMAVESAIGGYLGMIYEGNETALPI